MDCPSKCTAVDWLQCTIGVVDEQNKNSCMYISAWHREFGAELRERKRTFIARAESALYYQSPSGEDSERRATAEYRAED